LNLRRCAIREKSARKFEEGECNGYSGSSGQPDSQSEHLFDITGKELHWHISCNHVAFISGPNFNQFGIVKHPIANRINQKDKKKSLFTFSLRDLL
jgi:hypothetical protein